MNPLAVPLRRRRQYSYRRYNPPTLNSSSSPPTSALPSPTASDQSPAQRTAARDSLTSISTTSSSNNNSNNNNTNNDFFIQQNPRYSSLWLQKCLLPRHLTPSTLTGAGPHYLTPNCYPYPNMADSVDRVFVHALHTVKRLPRTGSARPPEHDRLALYGLYKQATEGDVAGLPRHHSGSGNGNESSSVGSNNNKLQQAGGGEALEDAAERAKWEAWASHGGMGKTAAKRAYIEVLIKTMRMYAMGTVEARELVGELEFVWDQIREGGAVGGLGLGAAEGGRDRRRRRRRRRRDGSRGGEEEEEDGDGPGDARTGSGLRVLRPMSEGDDIDHDHDYDHQEEADADADSEEEEDFHDPEDISNPPVPLPTLLIDADVRDRKWRTTPTTMTQSTALALSKLRLEIKALREMIESLDPGSSHGTAGRTIKRRYTTHTGRIWAWVKWALFISLRHVLVDGVLLGLALLVLWARQRRRKGDWRLWLLRMYDWVRERVERGRVGDALKVIVE